MVASRTALLVRTTCMLREMQWLLYRLILLSNLISLSFSLLCVTGTDRGQGDRGKKTVTIFWDVDSHLFGTSIFYYNNLCKIRAGPSTILEPQDLKIGEFCVV